MVLEGDLLMQGEALRVLREELDSIELYLGAYSLKEARNRRLAVLATINDLQTTHRVTLTPKDALWLWNVKLLPLQDPTHQLHRKHFFDFSRHLTQSHRSARARTLIRKDDERTRNVDQAKAAQIRSYIESNSFPEDVSLEDVVHVVSRDTNSEIFS